jgi:hypothetical protein
VYGYAPQVQRGEEQRWSFAQQHREPACAVETKRLAADKRQVGSSCRSIGSHSAHHLQHARRTLVPKQPPNDSESNLSKI